MQIEEAKLELLKLKPKLDSLGDALKIEEAKKDLTILENKTADPNFWSDTESSQKILSQIKNLSSKIKRYQSVEKNFEELEIMIELSIEENDISDLEEIQKNLKSLEKELKNQLLITLLTGEYDSQNAILTLHAGAGGTESQDWAEMLL